MVVDSPAEISERITVETSPLVSKDEAAKKWLYLRQHVLTIPAKEIVGDILGRSKNKPEDLTQIETPIWDPHIEPYNKRKMVVLCERGPEDVSIKGFESLRAGMFFTVKETAQDGTETYLVPYPDFKPNGDYDEENSLIIKLNSKQYAKLKEVIENEK